MSNSSIWPIGRTLSSATISSQIGPRSHDNEEVLWIPQSSGITGASPSDCLMSYPGHLLGGWILDSNTWNHLTECKQGSSNNSFKNKVTCKLFVYKSYIRVSLNEFTDFFFVWALLLIVHTWNSSPLPNNLLRLKCTCCTVPTTSGRPQGGPLVWACQWPSSQPLLSPQLSHKDSLGA